MFRISLKVSHATFIFFTVLMMLSIIPLTAEANSYTASSSSVDLNFTGGLNSSISVSDTWSGSLGVYDSSHQWCNVSSVAPIGISDPNVGLTVIGSSYSSLSNSNGSISSDAGATYTVVMLTDLSAFTVTLKSLPAAITNDSFTLYYDGTGSGTADTALTVNVHINFTVTISPSALTSPVTVGTSYSANLSSSGGISPYTYAVTSGSLPAGVTLSSAGQLSGTPTTAGTYPFTITSTDSVGYKGSQTYSLTIMAPTITLSPTTLNSGTVGASYSTTFSSSGGISPYTYAVTSGSLPSGLSLNTTTGNLSGIPTSGGNYSFTVTATDGSGNSYPGSHAYSLTINSPPSTPTLSDYTGTVGTSFSASLSASGATSYMFSGSLPDGLSLNTGTGAISGTPTKAGDYNCVFTATNSTGPSAPSAYTFTIAAPTITLSPATLSSGTVGTSYSTNFSASGGISPYTYAVTSGSLPVGLTLSSAGILSGTPTAADLGTSSFTITATDSSGHNYTGSQAYSLTILTAPSAPTLSGYTGAVGTSFSATLSASGATSYALATGSLPDGLSLNTGTGAISGTPTKAGTYSCSFTATNGAGTSATSTYTFTIAAPAITLSPSALTSGTVGTPYSTTISANGGISPYSYALTSGALPPGLSLSTTGVLSGTPTAAGTSSFTITATDSSGHNYTGSQAYSLTINTQPSAPTLSGYTGTAGTSFSAALSASGATSYALASGSLPDGLSLNFVTGVISGTPTKAGTYPCKFTATNSAGTSAVSPVYTFTIAAPTITLSPASAALTSGKVGTAYSTTFTATGGVSPYSYTVTSGTLPAGLSLSTAGVLSGTPIAAGTYSFTITATDSSSYTVSQPYTLAVTLAAPTVANKTVKVMANSTSNPIDMSNSISGTYTSISVVNQPSHGSAAVSGSIIDYVPAQGYSGSDSFSYTATGPGGTSAAATVSITVLARSDPSKDKEVTGILSSQASMAKSFGTTQISNIQGHLESLHSSQSAINNDDRSVQKKRQHTLNLLGNNEGNTVYKPTTLSYNTSNTTPSTKTLPLLGLNFTGKPDTQGFSWWSAGSIQIGRSKSESDKISSTSIRTNGITLGVDRQLNPLFTFGGAINWGKQYNEIGDNGSKVDGSNCGIALYSSWHPQKGNYWDIIMGYQTLNFHNDRYITDSGGFASSDRHGNQWYASVISGHENTDKHKLVGVYSRLTTIQTHLDETSENNSGIYALTYAGQTIKSLNWAAGLRMEWPGKKITPKTRIEYQHEFQDTGSAYVAYSDDLSTWYQIAPQEYGKNVLNTEFGFDWAVSKSEKIELLYAWHSYFSGNKFGYFSWKYRYQY